MEGANKKRRAEKQWQREEVDAGLDERDAPVIEGEGIQVATVDEIKTRRIVRGRRRHSEAPLQPLPGHAAATSATTPAEPKRVEKEAAATTEEVAQSKEEKGQSEGTKEPSEHVTEETTATLHTEKEEPKATNTGSKSNKETATSPVAAKTSTGGTSASPATWAPSSGFFFSTTKDKDESVPSLFSPTTNSATGGFFFGTTSSPGKSEKKGEDVTVGWVCACCTEKNPESATSCSVCLVPRPAPQKQQGWKCACCENPNPADGASCSVCLAPQPQK